MEPAQPEPFRTVFFEECLRLFGGLDHLFGVGAFETRQLRDRHRESSTLLPVILRRAVSTSARRGRYVLQASCTRRNRG